jgi:primosomal protein N'
MPRYARISINIPQLTGLFDYSIPHEFESVIQVGSLVNVPLGNKLIKASSYSCGRNQRG